MKQNQEHDEYRSQHYHFARTFIPEMLYGSKQSGFIKAMLSPEGTSQLREAWRRFEAASAEVCESISPAAMVVSAFEYGNISFCHIIFPEPKYTGEAYFGLIVIRQSLNGRVPGDVEYFLLQKSHDQHGRIYKLEGSDEEKFLFKDTGQQVSVCMVPEFPEVVISKLL